MESTTIDSQMSGPQLQIDSDSARFLSETARWAKFLAIVGFVFCGLVVIVAIFTGGALGAMMNTMGMAGLGGAITFIYILLALIYFFPCLYLFNFGNKMKAALSEQNQTPANLSFSNLKSCFKFMRIFTIIILSLYALGLIFGGLAASMM